MIFIDLPGGPINDPSPGKYFSLPFLQATHSSLSRSLEGIFEMNQRPSMALCIARKSQDAGTIKNN